MDGGECDSFMIDVCQCYLLDTYSYIYIYLYILVIETSLKVHIKFTMSFMLLVEIMN